MLKKTRKTKFQKDGSYQVIFSYKGKEDILEEGFYTAEKELHGKHTLFRKNCRYIHENKELEGGYCFESHYEEGKFLKQDVIFFTKEGEKYPVDSIFPKEVVQAFLFHQKEAKKKGLRAFPEEYLMFPFQGFFPPFYKSLKPFEGEVLYKFWGKYQSLWVFFLTREGKLISIPFYDKQKKGTYTPDTGSVDFSSEDTWGKVYEIEVRETTKKIKDENGEYHFLQNIYVENAILISKKSDISKNFLGG